MVTGELRNKIDAIRQDVWNSGVSNPMTVVDQLTYLMFIHQLDEREIEIEHMETLTGVKVEHIFPQSEIGQSMRWSRFKDRTAQDIYRIINDLALPAIKEMKGGRLPDFDQEGNVIPLPDGMDDVGDFTAFSEFMQNVSLEIKEPVVLQKVVTGLDDLFENEFAKGRDIEGDFYEYMLNQMATSGELGQFRTPKHIRDMMVELIAPAPDDDICDPACGTAGFLTSAVSYIREHYEPSMTDVQWSHFTGPAFSGFDTDPVMTRLSAMNLVLHGVTHPQIKQQDSVSKKNPIVAKYDVILANPPFTGSVNKATIDDNLRAVVDTPKTELLFVALFLRMLKTGGRCACIVPDGVVFGSTKAHKQLRKELVEKHNLQAVISLPQGVFKPYSGVSTAILVFTKTGHGGTSSVWFYDMQADGYSLDDKRNVVEENDIPDIIARFHNLESEKDRARTEKSFLVPKEEIAEKDYELAINRYKETVYVPVEYPPTSDILDELDSLEAQIAGEMKALREMLK